MEKPLQEHITHHYSTSWRQNLRKIGHIRRKRKSCFTKTTHLSCRRGENPRIMVWTVWPSTLLVRSSPKRLPFVPSSKNCARRTEIFFKRRGNHLVNNYFVEHYLDGLQRWIASLGEVCRVTRRLCWKIKKMSEKMSCIFVRSETFQTTLV